MLRRVSLAAAAAASALLLVPADAGAQMTMSLASAGRGGGVNTIIDGYFHTVEVAQTTGAARARTSRTHQPFTVRKRVDRSTPLLYRALVNSETIPSVTLRIPTSRASGGPTMTITLTDARIVSIKSAKDEDLPTEHVSFNFAKIKWTSSDGGTEFEDNWRENN